MDHEFVASSFEAAIENGNMYVITETGFLAADELVMF